MGFSLKSLGSSLTKLVGNPLGNLAFTTPNSTVGKVAAIAGAVTLGGPTAGKLVAGLEGGSPAPAGVQPTTAASPGTIVVGGNTPTDPTLLALLLSRDRNQASPAPAPSSPPPGAAAPATDSTGLVVVLVVLGAAALFLRGH